MIDVIDPKKIIQGAYGSGPNFITPRVIKYGWVGPNTAYELSSGEGFEHEVIYGVTLATYDPKTVTYSRLNGECFHELEQVETYINALKAMHGASAKGKYSRKVLLKIRDCYSCRHFENSSTTMPCVLCIKFEKWEAKNE